MHNPLSGPRAVLVSALLGAAIAFGAGMPASAADEMFLHVDTIPGESTDNQHPEWIVLNGLQHSVERTLPTAAAPAGNSVCGPLVVTKTVDKATSILAKKCAQGVHFPTVVVTARRADSNQRDYLKMTMKDVIITSVRSETATRSAAPSEAVAFSYAHLEVSYSAQKTDGTLDTPIVTTIDCNIAGFKE